MLVVKCRLGIDDALVQVVELLCCPWRVSFAALVLLVKEISQFCRGAYP